MGTNPDQVPAYLTVRMTAPETEEAERANDEAWRARHAHPDILFIGPVFSFARERDIGGWEFPWRYTEATPQPMRDTMDHYFRVMAAGAEQSGDRTSHAECMHAAERLGREVIDELTVLGDRYRVVRVERFIRSGPGGPEGPRSTDPDPGDPEGREAADPTVGFVIDPIISTGVSAAVLTLELRESVYPKGHVPPEVWGDSRRATQTHPGGVLLPPAFTVAECIDGQWKSSHLGYGTSPTPQAARERLALHFRVTIPWKRDLSDEDRVPYSEAADRLDADRVNRIRVSGRTFRVARVERMVRIGPDGPEGPRPSDYDPEPPVMVQEQQRQSVGRPGENPGEEPDSESGDRFAQLMREEEARLLARKRNAPSTEG
jgi:hypothetical protein